MTATLGLECCNASTPARETPVVPHAPVTVREVASRAGVSLGTVSNVLNRPETVAETTRRRVLDAVRELGFVRNESARQLRAGRSRTISLIVLDVGNPFFTDIARGVEETAEQLGLGVVLCNSAQRSQREERYLSLAEEQRVLGVLISPVGDVASRLEVLRERGIPSVLVDRGTPSPNQCSVSVDDIAGGKAAVEHLVDHGHRRIGYVGGDFEIAQVRDRLQGAREAAILHGLGESAVTVVEVPALNIASGRVAGERLVAMAPRERPTAVFCANDLLALGVLQQLVIGGVRVPEDVAIVGYDDIEFAAAASVPLSSVRQPRADLGRTATALLLEETGQDSRHRHRQVLFQPDLVVRASSDYRRDADGSPRRRSRRRADA